MESRPEDPSTERAGADDDRPPPQPTAAEVHACQFSSWYDTFRGLDPTSTGRRKNVTIESVVVRPLPPEFLAYLRSDGVRLPECAPRVSSCLNDGGGGGDGWDDGASDDDDGAAEEEDAEEEEEGARHSFPALTARVQAAVTALGGPRKLGCVPKLNWSSPRDATWINGGSLRCREVGDVYLLLKSSDFVAFDLDEAWEGLADDDDDGTAGGPGGRGATPPPDFAYELVLRKWCNLHPSMEFRCFVHDHELVAVSQRHPSKRYPHLQPPAREPLAALLAAFLSAYVRRRFARGAVRRYVVDLYLDARERAWIVDFNVWGARTDALLFDWGELAALGARARGGAGAGAPPPELRVVTGDGKDMTYDPLSSYRGPTDAVELLNGDGGGPGFAEFMARCVRPSEME